MSKAPKGRGADKVHATMREFKDRELHSGSAKGPLVKSRDQAVAIALNTARKAQGSGRKK